MAEDTITEAELFDALANLKFPVSITYATQPVLLGAHASISLPASSARMIVDHAKAHREPAYVDGEYYKDAEGDVWCFNSECDGEAAYWTCAGYTPLVGFRVPKRPLVRLIPEK